MPHDIKRLTRTEPADAARLGEELRDARMALGLTIEDVAAALRIRRVYLLALEEGRARDLPAPAYAIGFVRSYARALGLDDDEMVRRFRDATSAAVPRKTDLVFPEPVPERGVPAGALVLAGAVVVIGAYVGWWHWSGGGDRQVDAVPPPPPRIEDFAALREPPVTPEPSPALPTGGGPSVRPDPAPQAGPPIAQSPGSSAAAAPVPVRPTASTAGVSAPPPPVAASVPTAARPPDEGRVQLRARNGDVWIQVRERANGPILVDRVLRAGESWSAPPQEGLVLATGNAGGLELVLEGRSLSLGPGQSVRRGILLDAEQLRGLAPSQPATAAVPAPPRPAPPRPVTQ